MASQPPPIQRSRLRRLDQRYEKLKRSVAEIGYVFPGSIVKHYMRCGKPNCRCANDPTKRHGPYYDWSKKVRGKSVTVRLTVEQAKLYSGWINNRRKLKKILTQMEAVSTKVAQALGNPRVGR